MLDTGVLSSRDPVCRFGTGWRTGVCKSKTQDVLRDFIDPNQVNLRAKPKNRESLFVSAENSHLISYENLSHLQPDMQDAFCTLATGGGFADRTLYTNKEETIIDVKRPVVLNGISVLVQHRIYWTGPST